MQPLFCCDIAFSSKLEGIANTNIQIFLVFMFT